MKYLKNKRGNAVLTFVVIIASVAIVAGYIVVKLNNAIENRQDATIKYYNGTDTITEVD